ncbi:helix-turn-helix domain-containing protein [Parapedobacter deserti]|uniref:Helix-turn-helix domain-containing protein n=1 Tax=Parapedobacter deserti TaxID=1912957 RepID=A0ABV7JLA6_9SPHI
MGIGRYERGEVKPSIEVVIRMADALEVSLDFLVGKTELELDSSTIKRIQEVAKLPEQEKQQVFRYSMHLFGILKREKLMPNK